MQSVFVMVECNVCDDAWSLHLAEGGGGSESRNFLIKLTAECDGVAEESHVEMVF